MTGASTRSGAGDGGMLLEETLRWPFFDEGHRRFAHEIAQWADARLPALPHGDVDAACRARVRELGAAGIREFTNIKTVWVA